MNDWRIPAQCLRSFNAHAQWKIQFPVSRCLGCTSQTPRRCQIVLMYDDFFFCSSRTTRHSVVLFKMKQSTNMFCVDFDLAFARSSSRKCNEINKVIFQMYVDSRITVEHSAYDMCMQMLFKHTLQITQIMDMHNMQHILLTCVIRYYHSRNIYFEISC